MSDCRKCADLEWCVEHEECGLFKPKTMTNAERIRSMTDEELAAFFTDDLCELLCGAPLVCDGQCVKKMLHWLKQEAEEGK